MIKTYHVRTLFFLLFSMPVISLLQSCSLNRMSLRDAPPSGSPTLHLAQAAHLIRQGHPVKARYYLTPELRKNPNNCEFNLLNALSYHVEGHQNDYGKLKLAHVGYNIAKHNCHNNAWPYYYDAIIDFNLGDYEKAALDFATASQLSHNQSEKDIFTEGLILSSYAAKNLPQYDRLIKQLIINSHKNQFIYRHLNEKLDKEKQNTFKKSNPSKNKITTQPSHTSAKTNGSGGDDGDDNSDDSDADNNHNDNGSSTSKNNNLSTQQVIVDAIIILNKSTHVGRRGVNLLNALSLQYGYNRSYYKPSFGKFGRYYRATDSTGFFPSTSFSRVITHMISIPDITYDLNIFNSASEHSEILARPTLLAENGKKATYFSGDKLILGIASSDASTIETFPIGITMSITPTFLEDGSIDLSVRVGRDFILPTIQNRAVQFQNIVDTVSENVETTVNVHYGETIILSALSEKERAGNTDKTPGISRLPILKYLFKNQEERLDETSVLILLTPQQYIGFPNTSIIDTRNYIAYMHNALFDPTTNIYNVLKDLGDLSLYETQEQDFYTVLQFKKMVHRMLNQPLFRHNRS